MLEKDRFLEKISYLIFLIFIFLTQVLAAETTTSKILDYNASLTNSSALFIQNDETEIQEGEIYFGSDRIRVDYERPQKLTLILSEKKGVYINHSLKESQYFSTNKSFVKIFFKILKGHKFTEKIKVKESSIQINDSFVLDDIYYQFTIIYENNPIKIRKIIILEDNQNLEISFFDHNNLGVYDKKFFSMIDPYLN